MPNTYVALRTETVAVATNTVTFDLTGISGYTDLSLEVVTKSTTGNNTRLRFNNDSSSLYSNTSLGGTGSSAVSRRDSNTTFIRLDWDGYNQTTEFNVHSTDIQSYNSTSVHKTVLTRSGSGPTGVDAIVGLYRSNNAITRIDVIASTGNFDIGSTFNLYGIANADQGAAKATGGIITEDSQYWYHTFGASGAFIPKQSLTCDILQVAGGGGGGGAWIGGGGGAGGLLYFASQSLTAISHNVTVGAGGPGTTSTSPSNGSNSQFASLTASVGGGSGAADETNWNSSSGGSGGGGLGNRGASGGTTGQGNAGGAGTFSLATGGGGGGAGAAGTASSSNVAGAGGIGLNTWSSWADVTSTGANGYYAGGGAGGVRSGGTGASGGLGGGGNAVPGTAGGNAIRNTGGGGAGTGTNGGGTTGGAGGSGVVIIRYSK